MRQIVVSLLEAGLLEKNDGDYPTLRVSQQGKIFLKERRSISLPQPRRVEDVKSSHVPHIPEDSAHEIELFERLRVLRKRLADEKNVPPFVIFSDVSLKEMALYLPRNFDDFQKITGVGAQKLQQYGQHFIDVITSYSVEHHLEQRFFPSERKREKTKISGHAKSFGSGSTYAKTRELLLQKVSLADIATMRGLTQDTILSHLEQMIQDGTAPDIAYMRPEGERFERIKAAFLKSGGNALKPVRDLLGEDFLYEELRLARIFCR